MEPDKAQPSWVIGNLTFPFGNVTGEGSDGFPTYTGNNHWVPGLHWQQPGGGVSHPAVVHVRRMSPWQMR